MAGGSRSRLGCWTCRLRRKKCDERRPSCASCEGLGIDCHGYGQRPEWMDGCEKEKEAAANTRRAIKNAARREPGPAPSTGDRSASNAPSSSHESPDHSATGPSEDHLQTVGLHGPQNEKDSSVYETTRLAQSLPIAKTEPVFASGSSSTPWAEKGNINQLDRASSSSESPGHVDYDLTQALKGREASLLMYYFDFVFPLQFRMHNPPAIEGGRGWLLSLLLLTPPMYQMTLALSAHCFEMREVPNGGEERKKASLAQLGTALRNLQVYIRGYSQKPEPRSLEDNLKLLGCVLQMIAFIGFAGGTDNWQLHMKGASTVALGLVDHLLATVSSPKIGSSQTASLQDPLIFNEDEISLKFMLSVFIWIDITGSVALGEEPKMADAIQRLCGGPDPAILLNKVMGCQNWAMLSISKIACLDAWKRKSQKNGTLSMIELVKRATALETELTTTLDAFTRDRKTPTNFNQLDYLPHLTPLSIHTDYLTKLYASSALTYLHVVVSGPYAELPEIRGNVCKTIEMLKQMPSSQMPRTLWWPILITGSMALDEEEILLFRNLIAGAGVHATSLGPGYNILRTLEECWKMRKSNEQISLGDGYWGDIMSSRLQMKVLVM